MAYHLKKYILCMRTLQIEISLTIYYTAECSAVASMSSNISETRDEECIQLTLGIGHTQRVLPQ